MTMTAKYPGKCRACGKPIYCGDKIEWTKEGGARHVNCGAATEAAPKAKKKAYDCRTWELDYYSAKARCGYEAGVVVKAGSWRKEEDPTTPDWFYILETERWYDGDGDNGRPGYYGHAVVREATAEEAAPKIAKEEAEKAAKESAEKKAALESELKRIVAQGEIVATVGYVLPEGTRYDIAAEITGRSGSLLILSPDGSVSGVIRGATDDSEALQTTHDPRAAEILGSLIAGL